MEADQLIKCLCVLALRGIELVYSSLLGGIVGIFGVTRQALIVIVGIVAFSTAAPSEEPAANPQRQGNAFLAHIVPASPVTETLGGVERSSTAEGWTISVDHTLGDGCFMSASWETGTQLRIGFEPAKGMRSHLMVGNPRWTSLEQNKAYEIRVKFDEHPVWVIKSTAKPMGKQVILYKDFESGDFLTEFRSAATAQIFYNGKFVDALELGRNGLAYDEMLKCQAKNRGADPFAN